MTRPRPEKGLGRPPEEELGDSDPCPQPEELGDSDPCPQPEELGDRGPHGRPDGKVAYRESDRRGPDGTGPHGAAGDDGRLSPGSRQALIDLLEVARQDHFLGPGHVSAHLEHSLAFASLIPDPPDQAVDLGSGAGIPGLVLALLWPESAWILLDANVRRTAFLCDALSALGLGGRVEVLVQRAEVAGQDRARRARADLVVARGFGSPAVVAECAAPLLRPGGTLVVAEPPGGAPSRWPADGLELVGLAEDGRTVAPVALQRLRQATPCPDRYPRRVGVPAKRPLF